MDCAYGVERADLNNCQAVSACAFSMVCPLRVMAPRSSHFCIKVVWAGLYIKSITTCVGFNWWKGNSICASMLGHMPTGVVWIIKVWDGIWSSLSGVLVSKIRPLCSVKWGMFCRFRICRTAFALPPFPRTMA